MTETLILTPGHPAGCSCGECGCRRAHLEGAHQGDDCRHGVCLICTGCAECEEREREEQHDQYIDYLVKMLGEAVGNAESAVSNATTNLRELMSPAVYDIELTEGAVGGDALDDLAAAARLLRNVRRIVSERKRLLKEG